MPHYRSAAVFGRLTHVARPRLGERRIDKQRLKELLVEEHLNAIAKRMAARDGKTVAGARRQLQRWRKNGGGGQITISEENAARLSRELGVNPDEWSRPVTEADVLEVQYVQAAAVARRERLKADELAARLRELGRQLPLLDP